MLSVGLAAKEEPTAVGGALYLHLRLIDCLVGDDR